MGGALAETAAALHTEVAEKTDTSLAPAAVTRDRTDSEGVEEAAVGGALAEVTGATGQ